MWAGSLELADGEELTWHSTQRDEDRVPPRGTRRHCRPPRLRVAPLEHLGVPPPPNLSQPLDLRSTGHRRLYRRVHLGQEYAGGDVLDPVSAPFPCEVTRGIDSKRRPTAWGSFASAGRISSFAFAENVADFIRYRVADLIITITLWWLLLGESDPRYSINHECVAQPLVLAKADSSCIGTSEESSCGQSRRTPSRSWLRQRRSHSS